MALRNKPQTLRIVQRYLEGLRKLRVGSTVLITCFVAVYTHNPCISRATVYA